MTVIDELIQRGNLSPELANEILQKISEDESKASNLCRCSENYNQYPACKSLENLSEEQINLRGGMCVASTDGTSGGCSDVIIDFPRKFDLTKIIPRRK